MKSSKKYLFVLLAGCLLASCGGGSSSSKITSSSSEETSSKVESSISSESSKSEESSLSSTVSSESSIESSSSTVIPVALTITITNTVTNVYVGQEIELAIEATGEVGDIVYSVGAGSESIAECSEYGIVTFKNPGQATVIASSVKDPSIKDSIDFTVKDTAVDTKFHSSTFDFAGMYQEQATFSTKADYGFANSSTVHFRNATGKKYMTTATFNISQVSPDDQWSFVSLGHMKEGANYEYHGYCVSPGPSMSYQKSISLTTNDRFEIQWGKLTNNTQLWLTESLKSLDFTNVKLTSIRDGSTYYYYINDMLTWEETSLFTDYNDVDTIGSIAVNNVATTVSNMSSSMDSDTIDAYIAAHKGNGKLYPSNNGVQINESATEVKFTNNKDAYPTASIKENYAGSMGDAMILPAEKAATVEYDVTFDKWGADPSKALVALTLWNNGKGNADCRSACLGYQSWGATGWNHNYDFPGIGAKADIASPLELNHPYHIKVERLMYPDTDSQDMAITVFGVADRWQWTWTSETGSRGDVALRFGAQYCDATISNITISVAE